MGQSFAKFGFTAIFSALSGVFFLIEHSLTQIISAVTFLATSFYILRSDRDLLEPLVQIIPEKRIAEDFEIKFRKYGRLCFSLTLIFTSEWHLLLNYFCCSCAFCHYRYYVLYPSD